MTLALVNILGLGVLIMESPILFKFIKYVGAAYLVYLGIKGIMSKPRDSIDLNIPRTTKNHFITGYVTVLLNPKALIFFLSLFTLVVSPETPLYDRTIYVATISLISFSWFTGAALIFTNHHIKKRVFKHIHIIERGLGVAIIVIAIALLF
jgi:threonine/homoserine/homoserine lactone efflux protein